MTIITYFKLPLYYKKIPLILNLIKILAIFIYILLSSNSNETTHL